MFYCDNGGRLIKELRTGEYPYHIAYEYDPGGNRTRKVQSLPGCDRIETVYHYDVEKFEEPEEPVDYGSFNNRLMYYETSGGPSSPNLGNGFLPKWCCVP